MTQCSVSKNAMHVHHHILYGTVAGTATGFAVSPAAGALVLAGAVLLDVDHYAWYALRFRDLSFRRAWAFFGTRQADRYYCLCVLHTLEAIAAYVVVTALLPAPWRWLALGALFHMALDTLQGALDQGLHRRRWSLLLALFWWRHGRRRAADPKPALTPSSPDPIRLSTETANSSTTQPP